MSKLKPKNTALATVCATRKVIALQSRTTHSQTVDKMFEPDALVTTDRLIAYQTTVQPRLHDVWLSEEGENFQSLHWHIFNLMGWIREIHHHISA